MAKKQAVPKLTVDEAVELATLEANIEAEEVSAPAADVPLAPSDPLDVLDAEVSAFLVEARAAQGVYQAGNIVSGDDLKSLLNRAVSLLSR